MADTQTNAAKPTTARKNTQATVSDLPESVKLAAPHGFYDEAGDLQAWLQGEVVTAKADIKLLIERGARLFGIGDEPAEPAKAA
jgi:hypothetical protein